MLYSVCRPEDVCSTECGKLRRRKVELCLEHLMSLMPESGLYGRSIVTIDYHGWKS
ncbi:hypothetical protein BDW67DRAFT_155140 [Aspergillus spinulosporus]